MQVFLAMCGVPKTMYQNLAGESHNGFYLLTLFLTVYQLLSRLGVWVWGSGVGGLEVWMAVCMYHTYCGFSQKFFMTQSLVTIWHCLSTCSFWNEGLDIVNATPYSITSLDCGQFAGL